MQKADTQIKTYVQVNVNAQGTKVSASTKTGSAGNSFYTESGTYTESESLQNRDNFGFPIRTGTESKNSLSIGTVVAEGQKPFRPLSFGTANIGAINNFGRDERITRTEDGMML